MAQDTTLTFDEVLRIATSAGLGFADANNLYNTLVSGIGATLPNLMLLQPDIVANTSNKALAIPPSPPAASSGAGITGRLTTLTIDRDCTLGSTHVLLNFWQSGALSAGTCTIKCLINGVAQAETLVITSASDNPLTSSAFSGIAVSAGDTVKFTADFSALWDDGTGLISITLVQGIR